jgi:hypothetical protein
LSDVTAATVVALGDARLGDDEAAKRMKDYREYQDRKNARK